MIARPVPTRARPSLPSAREASSTGLALSWSCSCHAGIRHSITSSHAHALGAYAVTKHA